MYSWRRTNKLCTNISQSLFFLLTYLIVENRHTHRANAPAWYPKIKHGRYVQIMWEENTKNYFSHWQILVRNAALFRCELQDDERKIRRKERNGNRMWDRRDLENKKKLVFGILRQFFQKKVQFQLFSSLDRPFQCLLNNSRENDKQKFGRFFLIGSFNIFFCLFFMCE